METKFIKLGIMVFLLLATSACVVAPPPQPIGYRMSSTVLPTYVNGQYVGMQSSGYAAPSQASVGNSNSAPAISQSAPVYVQSPSSVVYLQSPAPVYTYDPYYPYYPSAYVDPWYGVGLGLGIGVGFSYFGRCCWFGGHGGHGGFHHHH